MQNRHTGKEKETQRDRKEVAMIYLQMYKLEYICNLEQNANEIQHQMKHGLSKNTKKTII